MSLVSVRPLADITTDERLQGVYEWVDGVPLSRPKRNINRDFMDGVMMAELVAHYNPKIVELHNYPPSGSHTTKFHNWETLNRRVFRRLGFVFCEKDLDDCAKGAPGAIERVLDFVKPRVINGPTMTTEPVGLPNYMPANIYNKTKEGGNPFGNDVNELREQVAILTEKNRKLEQLVSIKDLKIQALQEKLEQHGIHVKPSRQ